MARRYQREKLATEMSKLTGEATRSSFAQRAKQYKNAANRHPGILVLLLVKAAACISCTLYFDSPI